jgi:hydrogenase 3 maturation protease
MDNLHAFLTERLDGFTRLAVLGVGSVLRADDAAGMEVVRIVGERLPPSRADVRLFGGETAPENFSGSILRFAPTHLLIVDAADIGLAPGDLADICPDDVGGPSYCSHMLPIKIMVDYLVRETGAKVTLLGIQYRTLTFDGAMSPEVTEAVDAVCDTLLRVIDAQGRCDDHPWPAAE